MSPNGYYVPYEKTLLQSILYDGGGYVNERCERAMEICISKDGVVTSCNVCRCEIPTEMVCRGFVNKLKQRLVKCKHQKTTVQLPITREKQDVRKTTAENERLQYKIKVGTTV